MKNLITRSITGILFVAVILGAIWYSQESFRGLILITTILCLLEFYRLVNENTSRWILYSDILGGTYLVGILFLIPNLQSGLPAIYIFIPYLIYLLYSFIIRLYLKEENPIASWGHSFLGQVYIALPLGLLSFIAYPPLATEYLLMPYNALLVIAFFSYIWINDTGAYIVGCTIGKHRLFERISPKKSWEGFFGGLAFSLLLGWVWSTQCSFLNMGQWIGLSAVVSIFSTWGDLCESLLKRTLNVKDSGNILPGHGGLLDRLDSVFLASPATVIYLYLLIS